MLRTSPRVKLWFLALLGVGLSVGGLWFFELEAGGLHQGGTQVTERDLELQKGRDARRQALRPAHIASSKELTSAQKREILRYNNKDELAELADIVDRIDNGEIDDAYSRLMQLARRYPKRSEIQVELAMIELLDRKDKRQALQYFMNALRLRPDQPALQDETAQTFIDLKMYDEGLRFFNSLNGKASGVPGAYYILAKINWAAMRVGVALAMVNKALGQEVAKFKSYGLKSQILLANGQLAEAKTDLELAIKGYEDEIHERLIEQESVNLLVDELDDLTFKLVEVHIQLDEIDQAYDVVSKLAERIPEDPRVITLMDRLIQSKKLSNL